MSVNLWAKYQGYSLTFCPKLAHFHHFSMCNQNQSISISVICGQNTKAIALLFGQNWLIFITFQCAIKINQFQFRSCFGKIPRLQPYCLAKLAHFHHLSMCNQNQSISMSVICGQNTKAIALLFVQNWLIFITFQCAIKINQFHFRSFVGKIPRLQPYFLAKIGSFSSLFNVQSKSINLNFGHLWAKYQGYSLTFCPKLAHFYHFSMCNQNQSISISVICGQNTKAIALLFVQNWLIFITIQCAIKINQFQFRSFFGNIPRLQPYCLAKLAHFHHFSMCTQNQSISMSVICGQNTKAIALLFVQNWLIFITFQCAIKINQFQFRSFVGKIPRLQPYCLAKIGSFSSLFNVQSKSINFNFRHFWAKYQGYSLTFWPKLAQFHHFSMCNQNQSISISVICGQNTKAIALLFGQNWLIFITFQCAIKINQVKCRSFVGKIPRLQPYCLAKLAHFHPFSMCNQTQSISISVICGQNTKAIALLFGQNWLIFITFQCAIKINQFQFRSCFGKIPRLQPYCLAKLAHFHHLSMCNQNQSISMSVICGQNTKAIALLFVQNWLIFITFQCAIKINQFHFRSFVGKMPRLQPYFLAKIGSFSSLFNVQSKSINFINFGHLWAKYQGYSLTFCPKLAQFHHFSMCNQNQSISISVICGQNTKAIALLFVQNWLIFITFQCAIKINQFQFRSFVGKIPRLQPYCLAKLAHFHHFSMCNQTQSISISMSVICGQNTKAIALLFVQNWLIFITFQCAIKINQFQFRSFVGKIPRLQPYCLAKLAQSLFIVQSNQSISIRSFVGKIPRLQPYFLAKMWQSNVQSKSINFNFGHLWAKYQGYSLTFWPKLAHFHHCFNVQSKSINFNFGHLWAKYQGYSLTVWPKLAHFHHFQCAIKINQFEFRSFVGKIPRLQPYFLAKLAHFHHFSMCKINQMCNQTQSIFNFGHLWAKYQGYSLTFCPKLAHFHHFSMCNQNQSISISVIFRQNTKAIALLFGKIGSFSSLFNVKLNQFQFRSFVGNIALLFGQNWLIFITFQCAIKINQFQFRSISAIALLFGQNWLNFITFQCAIKINQFQFRSFVGKIPRLQPYFLAKIGSFSSLFNVQSKSINFNVGHLWAKYQGYSLTFWPKLAHFHHFSMCNQNQSISISVICGQNTKAIALLFGQNWLIFITPFNVQSKSINFNFGHLWAKYQGYSLTFWPKLAHFHHLSMCNQNQSISISVICGQNTKAIALLVWPKLAHFHHFSMCNQNQSISISVICGQNTKAIALLFGQNWLIFITFQCAIKINQFQFRSFVGKIPRLQPYFLAKIGSFSSLFNVQSKSINFHHFSMCNQNQSS